MLSLNTDLLSFFVVLASEKDLGDYKMSTFMGFGTGGLGPMDSVKVISDSIQTANAGVFVGFLLKTPYFGRTGGMDIVGEFDRDNEMAADIPSEPKRIGDCTLPKGLNKALSFRMIDRSIDLNGSEYCIFLI